MRIRKAVSEDIPGITAIYDELHTAEEQGNATIGWARGVYPTEQTAIDALNRDDIFVLEDGGEIYGAAIINQTQVDVYQGAPWEYPAEGGTVCVLHTLVISPRAQKRGFGKQFVAFYEEYARTHGWLHLRMDTNQRNQSARRLYASLGYKEIGIVPCVFNGIEGVGLVLLEKKL